MSRITAVVLFVFGLFFSTNVFSQDRCGHVEYLKYLESIDSGINRSIDESFFRALSQSKIKSKRADDTVYRIKVVFHVVYNSDIQNIHDSLIYSQLEDLNHAFRRTNADTINTRDTFKDVAGDARIEFELAQVDPLGNPTDGIVRQQSVRQTFGSSPTNLGLADLVKNPSVGSAAWDTEKYLNIWICDLSIQGFDNLLGYAYPPTGAPNWNGTGSFSTSDKQGVVVTYKVVGKNNPQSTATGSKTMIHEVGHYLGLRHIWGDGGCNVDDFMDDTPRARRASNGCNLGVNTCAELQGLEYPDMLENYMDYSTGTCQNMFTNDQIAQMRSNLRMFRNQVFEEEIYTYQPLPDNLLNSQIYPNPAIEELSVYISQVEEESVYVLSIYNMLGQVCEVVELQSVEYQKIGGLSALKGMYIYQLKKGEELLLDGKLIMGY